MAPRCGSTAVQAEFRVLRNRRDASVFLYAFDLIELDGADLRREPLEVRKATLVSVRQRPSAAFG